MTEGERREQGRARDRRDTGCFDCALHSLLLLLLHQLAYLDMDLHTRAGERKGEGKGKGRGREREPTRQLRLGATTQRLGKRTKRAIRSQLRAHLNVLGHTSFCAGLLAHCHRRVVKLRNYALLVAHVHDAAVPRAREPERASQKERERARERERGGDSDKTQ